MSLERQDYEQAAYYFAPNALIDQGHPYRLTTKSEAFAFNASLPCRADLIRLQGGGHAPRVLATFRLRGHYFALSMLAYPLAILSGFEWRGSQEVTRPLKREIEESGEENAA